MAVEVGKKVPSFTIAATSDKKIKLADLKGKNVILYFYPRDSTPGCTLEGHDFAANLPHFDAINTVIFGVSRDSMASHEKFKEKQEYPFELLSDEDEKLCTIFDVIKEKNMYGKMVVGLQRSTFLIDESGKLAQEWRNVKVKGHVEKVLAFARKHAAKS